MKKSTKQTPKTKQKKVLKVKTGTVDSYFSDIRHIMKLSDQKKTIPESHTLVFEDPLEMLQFLSDAKVELVRKIRSHPDSITNIAKTLKRKRTAVYRDIQQLEAFGLVHTRKEINPGHGLCTIVETSAGRFKLEAYI